MILTGRDRVIVVLFAALVGPVDLHCNLVCMLHRHGLVGDYRRLVVAVTLVCIPCMFVGSALLVIIALLVGLAMMTRSPVPGPLLLTLVWMNSPLLDVFPSASACRQVLGMTLS